MYFPLIVKTQCGIMEIAKVSDELCNLARPLTISVFFD